MGISRRQFLTQLTALSLLGVSGNVRAASFNTPVKTRVQTSFCWLNLESKQHFSDFQGPPPRGEAGSIMKLIATAMLAQNNLPPLYESFECRGTYVLNHHAYHCQSPHGKVHLTQALGVSCNGFFAHAAQWISPAIFLDYAKAFGLNQRCWGNASGPFPLRLAETSQAYVLGLSPDFQPTLYQLLRLSADIATRGQWDEHGSSKPLKPETWFILHEGMRYATRQGTAALLDPNDHFQVAAKTGTVFHGSHAQSWIIGFFPEASPRYAFALASAQGTSRDEAVPALRKALFSRRWS